MPDIDVAHILMAFVAIVLSLTVHEFAHAFVADRLGDPTPGRHGRLTLNPMVLFRAHPFGALLVPLVGAFNGFLVGWAATPVTPSMARRAGTLRRAEFFIAVAGPASNVVLAIISVGLFAGARALLSAAPAVGEPMVQFTQLLAFSNVFLALLNMLPIPPLDGFTVYRSLWPRSPAIAFIEQYGVVLLVVFLMYGGRLFGPVIGAMARLLGAVAAAVG